MMDNLNEIIDVTPNCLDRCNSLRHLPLGDMVARTAFYEAIQDGGVPVHCLGPRTGQVHPICNMSEEAKRRATLLAKQAVIQALPAVITEVTV